jgi:hypothetical protein
MSGWDEGERERLLRKYIATVLAIWIAIGLEALGFFTLVYAIVWLLSKVIV